MKTLNVRLNPRTMIRTSIDGEETFIDIFAQIDEDGLKEDILDEFGRIWCVEKYLRGDTDGIEIYTKYGKFIGTAYRYLRCQEHTFYANFLLAIVEQTLRDYYSCCKTMRKLYDDPKARKFIAMHSISNSRSISFHECALRADDCLRYLKCDAMAQKYYSKEISHLIAKINRECAVELCWFDYWDCYEHVDDHFEKSYFNRTHSSGLFPQPTAQFSQDL